MTDQSTPDGSDVLDDGTNGAAGTDEAIAQSTYDLLRRRLNDAAADLEARARSLNEQRLASFGASTLALLGTERIRTEVNAIPRDVATVGDQLVVSYNPMLGVAAETRVTDVFAVHHLTAAAEPGQLPAFSPNPEGLAGSTLDDDQFRRDFDELHTYFKEARLQQLYRTGPRLLAVFRTGGGEGDLRVLRWQIDPDGSLHYLDARGDRDHQFPARHDAEWTIVTRADHIDASHVGIADRILIDPLGGSLDIRIDDGGAGTLLLTDRLHHSDQSLQDAQLRWARAGDFVAIDLLPYGETTHRFYVVNLLTNDAQRVDALGQAFRQLPDGQGLIFPGGIYLRTGELRTFDLDAADSELLEVVRSPNGEDMLYVFHERESGRSILLPYNVVRQEVTTALWCHGHSTFEDGTMVLFREEPEPTTIHPVQIWSTPFCSDEWYAAQPRTSTPLDRIGNPSLVAGIADAMGLARLVQGVEPSSVLYADLLASAGRFLDTHHWAGGEEVGDLAGPAHAIRMVVEQVIDEFERTLEIQASAATALAEAEETATRLVTDIELSPPNTTEAFIEALASLRRSVGHLHTVREHRGIDTARVGELITTSEEAASALAQDAAAHLADDGAFAPYHEQLQVIAHATPGADSSVGADELLQQVDALAEAMDLVAGTVSDLVVDDPRVRTSVLEQVAGVLAEVNSVRAGVDRRRTELIQAETGAAFATELGLFGQSIATAVGRASTPEACDDALARLLLQLEQIETAGPRTDEQLDELATRRDQVTETFSSRRQQLVDERQGRAERLVAAAERTLQRVEERAATLSSIDDVNGFFAADPIVARIRSLVDDLRALGESVRADEVQSRLGAGRERAVRSLRDRQDLFDGDAVKLGRHRFSIDERTRELTVVSGGDHLEAVLTGTDLRLPIRSDALDEHRSQWDQPLASETDDLYRAAFLAGDFVLWSLAGGGAISEDSATRLAMVRAEADRRLDEGYDRGVHDVDADRILSVLAPRAVAADTLIVPGRIRAAAQMAWVHELSDVQRSQWIDRGRAASRLDVDHATVRRLADELDELIDVLDGAADDAVVARYLVAELMHGDDDEGPVFATTPRAADLVDQLQDDPRVEAVTGDMTDDIAGAVTVLTNHVRRTIDARDHHMIDEIVAGLLVPELERRTVDIELGIEVDDLRGQHRTIDSGALRFRADELLHTVERHLVGALPAHRAFAAARRTVLEELRSTLRVDDLEPRVPEGFVRNQLIDQVYLPLIGDNLARQIGTIDDQTGARSGLLMLLSPPGYGKTTLVEYVADRLGMALVKVSGPGLGHDVTSLDPAQAPSATAAREIERINLAFALGTNVILYLDDIQHTNPEFLQRFISLCDAQRRIEGVWNGEARAFDLRGKRFAVVMAGNPYTESGERFRVPDMLANRADTYNLGDVLASNDDAFAQSYLENALTANPVLAPLAGRGPNDLAIFRRAASGEPLAEAELEHNYSSVESNEMVATLRHLERVQRVVLAVNRQYIASAATADAYRTEPPFLMQGSYRNMARLASKLLGAMTPAEVEQLIDEHYVAESQALTGAAEWNLLKLAELRNSLTDEQRSRRDEILATFRRQQRLGGDERDPATRVVAAIEQVADALNHHD